MTARIPSWVPDTGGEDVEDWEDASRVRSRPRLASEMPGWVGSEPPPDALTEDDSWDRWPA